MRDPSERPKRIAKIILENASGDDTFAVGFGTDEEAEELLRAFEELGCKVYKDGPKHLLEVSKPSKG